MDNCKKCNRKLDMYYVPYCLKCDIRKITKGKHGSIAYIPLRKYGCEFVEGFKEKEQSISESIIEGNDTYKDYSLDEDNEYDQLLIKVLKAAKIKFDKNNVLFWISW